MQDCGDIVASKFFPVDDEEGEGQYPFAKPTTSADLIYCVLTVGVLFAVPTLRLWIGNTTSSILPVRCAQQSSVRRIATTSMKGRYTVTITTRRSSRNDAMDARQQSLSNLWKYSGMAKTNIGIPSAT